MTAVTEQQVQAWVERYVHAWRTQAEDDIAALFTEDAEYHEWPYETSWLGRAEIVRGWLDRRAWQDGGWDFEWTVLSISGDTAAGRRDRDLPQARHLREPVDRDLRQ